MGSDLYVVGQIFAGDVATHSLFALEEGACGKIVNSPFVTHVDRLPFQAIKPLKLLDGKRIEPLWGHFGSQLGRLHGFDDFFDLRFGDSQLILFQMGPDPLHDVETLIKPFKHLMRGFESQSPPVQLNAVTDDVHKTEPFPEQRLSDTSLEMIDVINGSSGIKVRRLAGEDPTQSKRLMRFASGRGKGFSALGGGRPRLTAGQSVDLIIVTKNGDIGITPGSMKEMIASDARQVSIA